MEQGGGGWGCGVGRSNTLALVAPWLTRACLHPPHTHTPIPPPPWLQVRVVAGERPVPGDPAAPLARTYSLCQVVAVEERPPGTYK